MQHSVLLIWLGLATGCAAPTTPVPDATSPETSSPTSDPQKTTQQTETTTEDCEITFPELKNVDTGTPPADTGESTEPTEGELSTTGLVAHWALDGDWSDAVGGYDMTATRSGGFSTADYARGGHNQAYGPTGEETDNGARAAALTEVDATDGVTMEGWYFKPDNNTQAVLFGFGDASWELPKLTVLDLWGEISVASGQGDDSVSVNYARPDNGCWHHLAVVVPPEAGSAITVYLDGAALEPASGDPVTATEGRFGEALRAGVFSLDQGGDLRIDEVRLWSRALSAEEVAIAATPRGEGEQCPGVPVDWEPGDRCEPLTDVSALQPGMTGEVRVLTDDTVAIVSDPTDWLTGRLERGCGTYLSAMYAAGEDVETWWASYQQGYAWLDTYARDYPALLERMGDDAHWLVAGCEHPAQSAASAEIWPVAARELWTPRFGDEEKPLDKTTLARVAVVTLVELPFAMVSGEPYAVQDAWGNRHDFVFDIDESISWALKVDQIGTLADAPSKYAYLSGWFPQAGSLALSRFEGELFEVIDEETGEVAYSGAITHRADAAEATGEVVYQLDFSALTVAGSYYIRVPGLGRSWSFELGQAPLGEAFFTHARGLFHARCAELDAEHTGWPRGDIHATYVGGFPPENSDYEDHAAEGWGFRDESDAFVSYDNFSAVAATATDELLPDVTGGWHDAGDFDRRHTHFRAVEDLLVAYQMFPENFTDRQLGIPESGNGVPDILDEALWGMDVWLSAQRGDGSVGTWIEATSHPAEWDPGQDTQPYYLSLATRDSSLHFARYAAMTGRVLGTVGEEETAATYIASAQAAYAFGADPDVRVSHSWQTEAGETHTWTEPPEPDAETQMWALVELSLATGDPVYTEALGALEETFHAAVANLWWQNRLWMAVPVALQPEALPDGWGQAATDALVGQADTWLSYQDDHAMRRIWWGPDHGYFQLMGWGVNLYMPLRSLVAAWRLTGDASYREAALLGVSALQGNNVHGRSWTTGLGEHAMAAALHLPSWKDGPGEVTPGITIYGPSVGVAWQAGTLVYGLRVDARSDPYYEGVDLPLMPPPWDNSALSTDQITDELSAVLPLWRRLLPLEENVVGSMEFTIWETISPAAAVTGCLMGPGWMPDAALLERQPRADAEIASELWGMP